jgi:predicted nucleotidyltransferase
MTQPAVLTAAEAQARLTACASEVRALGVARLAIFGSVLRGEASPDSDVDLLVEFAERHAKRARRSRSQLYAEALAEYLARHAPDEVTDAMNQVIDRVGKPEARPFLTCAVRRVLERNEW